MKNYTDLTGKKAIVTGAAQGLSLGMAEGLMEAGAKVCIIDVNPKAEEVAKEKCAQGYACHAVIANLTEEGKIQPGCRNAGRPPGYPGKRSGRAAQAQE